MDQNFVVILVGNSGVGKTSLIHRRINKDFQEGSIMSTIGRDIYIDKIEVDNKNIQLNISDTAGQELYNSIAASYYRPAKVCIFVASIDNRDSLRDLDKWKIKLENVNTNAKQILAINKIDLMPDIPNAVINNNNENDDQLIPEKEDFLAEVRSVLNKFPNHLFVSAKDGTNIDELFHMSASLALQNAGGNTTGQIDINGSDGNKNKCC